MGVGRRMQKQGPPPPLDESKVTRKRKEFQNQDAPDTKKRKFDKNSKSAPGTYGRSRAASTKPKVTAKVDDRKVKAAPKTKQPQARKVPAAKSKKVVSVEASASDDLEVLEDGSDIDMSEDLDMAENGLEGFKAQLDDIESDGEDEGSSIGAEGDDFLGLGSEASDSVVDSEDEGLSQAARRAIWSEDEDDGSLSDTEQLTASNIAGLSKQLDREQAQEAAEAQAELEEAQLQTNILGDQDGMFSDSDGDAEGVPKIARLAPDLQFLRQRISEAIRVLDNFSQLAEEGRSRSDYMQKLLKDICTYYGYSPFLAEKLFLLFPPKEALAFFDANETPRPVVLRTNTLRTSRRQLAQALISRGVSLEPVGKWSKVGLQVFESPVPLGATPEYLSGQYMLQAAASFLPVMALAPQEHERVLDMASAPGGKTTYAAALMRNTGCIFANDANKQRAKGLIGNIHRMGVKNTVICNYNALEFPKVMGGFDRVLLDAPCSGTGVISKDPSVKTNKTEKDFLRLPHLQKQLLLAAIDSTDHASKTGGYIVYSTCSVTVEENEQVVQYALSRRPNVKIVPTGLPFGREGFTNIMGKKFDASMKETRRFYPHVQNLDGFFVCKLKKTGLTPANAVHANGVGAGVVKAAEEEAVDRTPLRDEEEEKADEFGGWDEEEDAQYIERAKKKSMRRRGLNPKLAGRKPVEKKAS
ncbi:NOL1/NOP2/sun family putative RNA met [Eremomyces bilateralis CBS 781.70]|uniref:Nucleolar protein 2 n=1 Tax=Eremomyces bilateralis CBS 781.70 TaxID=1392243 RepID=A0A6G1G6B9_9PEZI|nr:NOL1/NOP2/sun family putative RNA met [Eremomyces bilateralis CBS 781.70]KAF1813379.1 NOL1/NOP2/sun family putative RNA met [Eremomyces bilateralis CBS 781.70]